MNAFFFSFSRVSFHFPSPPFLKSFFFSLVVILLILLYSPTLKCDLTSCDDFRSRSLPSVYSQKKKKKNTCNSWTNYFVSGTNSLSELVGVFLRTFSSSYIKAMNSFEKSIQSSFDDRSMNNFNNHNIFNINIYFSSCSMWVLFPSLLFILHMPSTFLFPTVTFLWFLFRLL